MSEPLRGVIVTHAAVAQALLAAVAAITGVSDALVPVSNDGCDSGALTERLMRAIGGRPAVLFVDLPGGSCLTTSVRLAKGATDVAVVTGVNPAMRPGSPNGSATRASGSSSPATSKRSPPFRRTATASAGSTWAGFTTGRGARSGSATFT